MSPLRLLGECLLITVVIELFVTALLPAMAPHSSGAVTGALDACLLLFFAAPLMYWRVRVWCNRDVRTARSHLHAARVSLFLAISVLLVGGFVSHIASWEMRRGIKESAHARFNELATQVISETKRRLKTFEYGLRGARGIFVASHNIDRNEFRDYVCSRDVPHEFPGVLGFGYIHRVKRASLDEYIQSQRQNGAPDFNVRTTGADPELDIVQYVEPLATNMAALGYDTRSDPVRRAAIERSFETGTATLTSKITLLQDARGRAGFLYLLPVYRHGSNPVTPQERREATLGWVYAAIVIEDALDGVTDAAMEQLDLDVFDGDTCNPAKLLYDTSPDDFQRPGQMFSDVHSIELGGMKWAFRVGTLQKFEASIDFGSPVLTAMGGMTVSTLLAAVVLFLGNGRTRALALARDMTRGFRESEQRAQDARARAESAAAALSAFKNAVDDSAIVSITDTQGNIIEVNDQFCAVSGYSREELIGNNHRVVSSQTHTPEFWARFWRCINTSGHWRGEVCNRAKDGSLYWLDTTISALRDHRGQVRNYIAIRFDICERKQAELELSAAQTQLQSVFDNATEVSIVVIGTDGIIQLFSRGAEKLLGYSASEVVGKATPDLFHDANEVAERAAHFSRKFQREIGRRELFMLAPQEGHPWNEWTHIRKDGSRVAVQLIVTELRDPDGNLLGHLGTAMDVTERRRAESVLREASIKADAANIAKSQFLANMSHEIRTPLTAILGYAELLEEDLKDQPGNSSRIETLDTIRNAGKHLLTVINDILDLSKIEAGKMNLEQLDVPLVTLFNDVDAFIRPRAIAKGIGLEMNLCSTIPSHAPFDPTRLRQIMLNLIGNAVKFTENGKVTVNVSTANQSGSDRLLIDVADTGPGMTVEQTHRLFMPFSQADNSVTRRHGGTGLGLIICRRLAEVMGGNVILVRTAIGEGTTFRIDLPLVAASNSNPVSSLNPTVPALGAADNAAPIAGRVLLVEDGIDNQKLIALFLSKAGATVSVADNGAIAWQMISDSLDRKDPFDLLLTDMQMPEIDGYTLASMVRNQRVDLPVIALTAHAMEDERKRCLDAGCDDFIGKPINRAELIATCRRWMRSKRHSLTAA